MPGPYLINTDLPAFPDINNIDKFGEGMKVYNALKLLQQTASLFAFPVTLQGADPSGVQDSTAAFNAAIVKLGAMGRSALFVPEGNYEITGAINIAIAGIKIIGAGRWKTNIKQRTAATRIINSTADFFEFSNIGLSFSAAVPATGAIAIYSVGNYALISEFIINNGDIGIYCTTGVAQKIRDFDINNYETSGIVLQSINDIFISKGILNAGNSTRGLLGGLRLIDQVEAAIFTDVDVLLGKYGLTTDAASYIAAARPAYCKFTNVYFDSSTNINALIHRMIFSEFVSCWFAGGRSGAGFPGCELFTSLQIKFSACTFTNCGSYGAFVHNASVDTVFEVCTFESNSVNAGAGIADGLCFEANTNKFKVLGCTARTGLFTANQGVGINVLAGTSNDYIIANNSVQNNAVAGIVDGGNGNTARVHDNVGYNPVGPAAIVVGASPYTYTAAHCPETIYITGAGVTAIAVNGTAVFAAAPATIHLGPNETTTVTYGALPVINKMVH